MSDATAKIQVITSSDPLPKVPDRTDPAPVPEATSAPTELEKRLSTIIGVTNDLRQSDTNRNTEISDLKAIVVGMNQQLEVLGNAKTVSAPPANTPVDPFSAPVPVADPSAADPKSFQDNVNSAVQQALQPLLQQNSESAERLKKHQASYAKVAELDPAFSDPQAREKQLFDQIYNARSDIQILADAPTVVAEMVRGIISTERIDEIQQDLAKSRVSLPSTAGRGAPQGDPEKVQEAYRQLQAKGERTELTVKEREDYLNLAVAKAHLDADA